MTLSRAWSACVCVAAMAAACAKSPIAPTAPPATTVLPNVPAPSTAAPTLAVTRFMAFGDSLTEGEWWPGLLFYDPNFTNAYPTFVLASLKARYTSQTFVMINEGLGGYLAADDVATGRFAARLVADQPQVVLLMQGVNDLIANPTTSGISSVVQALRTDIRNAATRNAFVFISTLTAERDPNPGGIDDPNFKDRHYLSDSLLVQANSAIKTMAAAEGATLIDGYAITAADPNRLVGADGLHLTIEGYQALAAAFFNAIKAKYEVPGAAPNWARGPSLPSLGSHVEIRAERPR